jgi:integrase/recombinase XerC
LRESGISRNSTNQQKEDQMQIDEFIAYQQLRGYSPATRTAYRRELQHFEAFLKSNRLRITQVRPKTIVQYAKTSTRNPEPNWTTVSRKLAILHSFYDFVRLTSNGRVKNPVDLVRRPRRQQPNPKPASEQVLDAMVAQITDARDRAILMLFRSSGLRLSELASLDRDTIQIEDMTLPFDGHRVLGVGRVNGKGGKEREFLVDLNTVKQIQLYLDERGEDGLTPLFLSNRGKRIDIRTIQAMLANWCRKLNLPALHPHAIRHAASTAWHRLGMDTLEISKLLGHASVATTNLYVHPDSARLRAQYFASMEMAAQVRPCAPSQDQAPNHNSELVALVNENKSALLIHVENSTQSIQVRSNVE